MKTVYFFDIGNVLLDFDLEKLAQMLVRGRTEYLPAVQALRGHDSHIEVESGRMTGPEYVSAILEPILPGCTYEDLVAAWTIAFSENATGRALLRDVRAAGHPAYLLSNTSDIGVDAIEAAFPWVFEETDGGALSFRVGHMKPAEQIYRYACELAGADPSDCFFFDDLPECVEGARAFGIKAFQFSADRIEQIRSSLPL